MKKISLFSFLCLLFSAGMYRAQITPIAVSNQNFDAVAEATTAALHTTGALDGSDYILYSQAYGTNYSGAYGLANSGTFASGNYTFQMAPYAGNNVMYLTGGSTDSLIFTTPAAYAGLSLLCFATEGSANVNATLRFTDNTTQVYSNQTLNDWFGTGSVIVSGFDRAGRTSGNPTYNSTNPKFFNLDLPINCTNRSKNVKTIKFQNTSSSARALILAVSGAPMPSFSITTNPVTCQGGTNGSAYAVVSGGIPPYTYTWSTSPIQTGTLASNLSVGVYSYTAQDAGACPINGTFAVSQSLVAQPALSVTANLYTVCAGSTVSLSVTGATSYTWNNNSNTSTISVNPLATSVYTVGGYTSQNCYRTGTLSITVNALPVISFTTPAAMCVNHTQTTLNATPLGGGYAGQGVVSNVFDPATAGVGTKTLSYTYTDANGCTAKQVNTIVVNAIPVLSFTLSPTALCANSPSFNMNAQPAGGTYTGSGVTGNVFSPSAAGSGTKTVFYEYTDANGCMASTSSSVIIFAVPNVSIVTNKRTYCTNTNSLYFNASPSGGVYSGPGISPIGVFTPSLAGAGNHTITYNYTDVYGCSNSAMMTLTVSNCNGIDETLMNMYQLQVFPNPSEGIVFIKSLNNLDLQIHNELGQLIKHLQLRVENNYSMEVNDLAPGVYFIQVAGQTSAPTKKIIVLR